MTDCAIGDSLFRLCSETERERVARSAIKDGRDPILEGWLRALAMTRNTASEETIEVIIRYLKRPLKEQLWFWLAAAAPGLSAPSLKQFLEHCKLEAPLDDTKRAAIAALDRRYLTWTHL